MWRDAFLLVMGALLGTVMPAATKRLSWERAYRAKARRRREETEYVGWLYHPPIGAHVTDAEPIMHTGHHQRYRRSGRVDRYPGPDETDDSIGMKFDEIEWLPNWPGQPPPEPSYVESDYVHFAFISDPMSETGEVRRYTIARDPYPRARQLRRIRKLCDRLDITQW